MKRFLTALFNQLASITLTIILLSAISLLIGLQLAAPQLKPLFRNSQWLTELATTDFFHSRLFVLFLILFCINLIACTLKHLNKTVALFRASSTFKEYLPDAYWPVSEVIEGKDIETVTRNLTDAFTRHFRKPIMIKEDAGLRFLMAERGRYTNLGFYLAHLSILTLVIGVIMSLNGYTYYIDISEGRVIDPLVVMDSKRHEKRLDFGLRCDEFKTLYYEGTTKVFKHESTLSIVKDGTKVKTQVVDFGTALSYGTLDIYQDRFVNRIERAKIQVITPTGEQLLYEVKNGEIFRLPGINLPIRAAAFRENSLQLLSLSPPDRLWISNTPARFLQAALSGYQFSLSGFSSTEMTNLKIVHDPGKGIVWYSFLSMIAGFCIMFFLSHRRIWAMVEARENGCEVKLGGTSTKNPQSIQEALNLIARETKGGVP
jgi:cytochrome c biogenesis protein